MNDITRNIRLAIAAQLDLDACMKAIEAATIRGDKKTVADTRQRAHDILDLLMDLKSGAMIEVIKLGRQ